MRRQTTFMPRLIYFVPFILAVVLTVSLVLFLLPGERAMDEEIQRIDRAVPNFQVLDGEGHHAFDETVLQGSSLYAVNFFASWCVPCVAELPYLRGLKNQGITVLGIAWRDEPVQTRAWLDRHETAYDRYGHDTSLASIAWGITGVPETFFVYNARIVYHHRGVLDQTFIETVLPYLQRFVHENDTSHEVLRERIL